MKDNVFVRNNLYDERDGLKDLIYAQFGTTKQIREHLFPSLKYEVDNEKIDKFITKYTKWLGSKIDKSENLDKYINKEVIRNLLSEELIKNKKIRQSMNSKNKSGVRIKTKHSLQRRRR